MSRDNDSYYMGSMYGYCMDSEPTNKKRYKYKDPKCKKCGGEMLSGYQFKDGEEYILHECMYCSYKEKQFPIKKKVKDA